MANTTLSTGGSIYFPVGTYRVSSALTFPSNVELWFAPGAKLSPDTGIVITINGHIRAPFSQIFTGLGTISLGGTNEVVAPQWWGAAADGTTDDTTAIAAAIAAVPTGGTLNLGYQKYAIISQIAISSKRLNIFATGQGGIVEKTAITGSQSAGAMVLFSGSSCADSTVQGVNFYGIETNASFLANTGAQTKEYCAVYFSQCDKPQVLSCKISGKRYGVVLDRCTNGLVSGSNFTGILTADTGTANYNVGVAQEGGSDHIVTNCSFYHFGNPILTGVSITGSQTPYRMTVSKCEIDTCWNNGVYFSAMFDGIVADCAITNVGTTGNAANAIKMFGSRNIAIGNRIDTAQVGIGIGGLGTSPDSYNCTGYGVQIIGNVIKNCATDGINLADSSGYACRNVTILGNYFVTIAVDNNAYGLIRGDGYFHHIAENTFEDSRSQYGILLSPGGVHTSVQGVTISRNRFVNCAGKGMHLITCQNGAIENNIFTDMTAAAIVLITTSTGNIITNNKGVSGLAGVVVSLDAGSSSNVLIKNIGGSGGTDLSADETINSVWLGPRTGSAVPSMIGVDRGQLYAVNKSGGDRLFVGRNTGSANQWESVTDIYIPTENGSNNAIACATDASLPALYDGLKIVIKLAHTLQAGANTFAYKAGAALAIVSHLNVANNIATAYASGSYVTLIYADGINKWQDAAQ